MISIWINSYLTSLLINKKSLEKMHITRFVILVYACLLIFVPVLQIFYAGRETDDNRCSNTNLNGGSPYGVRPNIYLVFDGISYLIALPVSWLLLLGFIHEDSSLVRNSLYILRVVLTFGLAWFVVGAITWYNNTGCAPQDYYYVLQFSVVLRGLNSVFLFLTHLL